MQINQCLYSYNVSGFFLSFAFFYFAGNKMNEVLETLVAPFIGLYQVGCILCVWVYSIVLALLPRKQKSVKNQVSFFCQII